MTPTQQQAADLAAQLRVSICGQAPRRTDHRQMDLFGSEA